MMTLMQFLSLLVGVLFFGQTTDQAGIQNISGALFWVCLNQAFLNYSGVLTVSDHCRSTKYLKPSNERF